MVGGAEPTTVSVLTEVPAVTKAFDYAVPTRFEGPLGIGARVRVPLHGRSVRGWIVDHPLKAEIGSLKELKASLGFGPPSEVVDLARWAAWRWAGAPARLLSAASPDRIVRSLPRRPDARPIEVPSGELSEQGALLATRAEDLVLRVGATTDPFDLVLGFYSGLVADGALLDGSLVISVPGLDYASRLVSRLSRRGVPAIDLAAGWDAARSGWPVVVGTRMAAFAPVPVLAGALVLDAEDERLSSEASPTWRALDVLSRRATQSRRPLASLSMCPPAWVSSGRTEEAIDPRHEAGDWPRVAVVDRRGADPRTGWLSSELVDAAREALDVQPDGVAVACIVNRTGRAKLLCCKRCDAITTCSTCDAACVLDEMLTCPRCGEQRPVICTACGATAMKLLRPGTAQLADELGALLGVTTTEMTASTDPTPLATARVVVGTEAIVHRIRRTTLVAFLDLDHHLLAPRVGVELSTLALIGRAGRLVGPRRSVGGGTVLLQTRLGEHPVIDAARAGDPSVVLREDATLRRDLALPPWRAAAVLKGVGEPELSRALVAAGLDVRRLEEHRSVVLAPDHQILGDALFEAPRPAGRVTIAVDGDSF